MALTKNLSSHIPLLSGCISSVMLPTYTESDMTQPVAALTCGSVPVVAALTNTTSHPEHQTETSGDITKYD